MFKKGIFGQVLILVFVPKTTFDMYFSMFSLILLRSRTVGGHKIKENVKQKKIPNEFENINKLGLSCAKLSTD